MRPSIQCPGCLVAVLSAFHRLSRVGGCLGKAREVVGVLPTEGLPTIQMSRNSGNVEFEDDMAGRTRAHERARRSEYASRATGEVGITGSAIPRAEMPVAS